MTTVTIKVNERNKAGRTFLDLVQVFRSQKNAIEIVEEKSPYNPEFVKKIKKAQKRGNYRVVNPNNIWEGLL